MRSPIALILALSFAAAPLRAQLAQPQTPPAPPAASKTPAQPNPGSGPAIDLRPKWHRGDVAKYTLEVMVNTTVRSPDDETKKAGELYRQEGRLVRRVVSTDETGTTLSVMFERL